VYDPGRDLYEQHLAVNDDPFVATRRRRQPVPQLVRQALPGDAGRQGLTASEVLGYSGRQSRRVILALAFARHGAIIPIPGTDNPDLILREYDTNFGAGAGLQTTRRYQDEQAYCENVVHRAGSGLLQVLPIYRPNRLARC